MSGCARFCMVAGFVITSSTYGGSARAEQLSPDQIAIIKATLDEKSLAKLQKRFPELANRTKPQQAPAPAKSQLIAKKAITLPAATTPNPPAPDQAFKILLRNDWSDLGILGACMGSNSGGGNGDSSSSSDASGGSSTKAATTGPGVSTTSAKGASLSFTRDYVANNSIWAAQGMVAAVYSDCSNLRNLAEGRNADWAEKSIAIYAQANSDYNSNLKLAAKNNIDTRTAGLSGELVYQSLSGDLHIFRLTPNVTQDDIHNTSAVAVMGQYIPAFLSLPGVWAPQAIINGNVIYQFDPTLDVQYASTTNQAKPILFSGMSQSLRIGPELALIVTPFAGGGNDFLNRIGINELFHPWYETYSNRGSYWWTNTIKYNLDQKGNFALAFSYNRGLDENSGVMTNQYVLSLNGKI